ncbi:hypothetical protein AMJ57_02190 [Parcubacteria bacterium SG8_24]|nr:MAG: hypothetical protein AMJ57_02190 [Parcubacteria bacterium SG8_24]
MNPEQGARLEREQQIEARIESIRSQIGQNAGRVKESGEWPDWVSEESLTARVPSVDQPAPGFDAGIACAIDSIPRDKQGLAAKLHAAYTPETIQQIRDELRDLDPDAETTWWLAASAQALKHDEVVNREQFLEQIDDFKKVAADPEERQKAARETYETIKKRVYFTKELGDDVPFGTKDGCIQAAYIEGYPFGVHYAESYGIYFIGTAQESLGLEDFQWSDAKDDQGRDVSGPVFGSKQFVKCANREELKRALEIVKAKFAEETKAVTEERGDIPLKEFEHEDKY